MILGILLVCNLEGQCMPVPNVQELYETMEDCDREGSTVIAGLPPHLQARLFCYETDFFELL